MYGGGVMPPGGQDQVQFQEPKQGSKRFNSITIYDDDPLCPTRYCILFIYAWIAWQYWGWGVSTNTSYWSLKPSFSTSCKVLVAGENK